MRPTDPHAGLSQNGLSGTTPARAVQSPEVLEVSGVFDGGTVSRLYDRVRASRPATQTVIDVTRARVVVDATLLAFAKLLREAGAAQITVRGLGNHQRRILSYLGVDPAAFQQAPNRHDDDEGASNGPEQGDRRNPGAHTAEAPAESPPTPAAEEKEL